MSCRSPLGSWCRLVLVSTSLVAFAPVSLCADTVQQWLETVRAARGQDQTRHLLGYRRIESPPEHDGPILVAALSDPNPGVRSAAALALGDLGWESPAAIDGLIRLLDDPDRGCRFRAAASLLKLSDSVIEPLVRLLRTGKTGSATQLIHEFSGSRDRKDFQFPLLAGAYVLSTRPAAAPALIDLAAARWPDGTRRHVYDGLVSKDGDSHLTLGLRAYSRMALRRMGAAAVTPLGTALARADLDRVEVLDLLGHLRRDHDVTAYLPSAAALIADADQTLGAHATSFLGQSGMEGARLLLAAAATRVDAPASAPRALAGAKLPPAPAVSASALSVPAAPSPAAATVDPDKERALLLRRMAWIPEQQVDLRQLASSLTDPNPEIQDAALDVWGVREQWRSPIAPDLLAAVLADIGRALDFADATIGPAFYAIRMLGPAAAPLAIRVQRWAATHPSDPRVDIAVEALESIGPVEGSKDALETLAGTSPSVRWECIRILVRWGALSRPVIAILRDEGMTGPNYHEAIRILAAAGADGMLALQSIADTSLDGHRGYLAFFEIAERGAAGLKYVVRILYDRRARLQFDALEALAIALKRMPVDAGLGFAKAGVDRAALIRHLLARLGPDEARDDRLILDLLLRLEADAAILADRAMSGLRRGDSAYHWRPVIEDVRVSPIFATALRAAVAQGPVTDGLVQALHSFPSVVQQSAGFLIAAARNGDRDMRTNVARLLRDMAPPRTGLHDPAVLAFFLESAMQVEDFELARMASHTLIAAGRPEGRQSLQQLVLRAVDAGEVWRIGTDLQHVAGALNDLDPVFELQALEQYLEALIQAIVDDETFEGEFLRGPPSSSSAPASAGPPGPPVSGPPRVPRTLPPFAWPPPAYSERDRITDLFQRPRSTPQLSLGEVDAHLRAALRATGYGVGGLYRIDGGFLRVSKLEQLTPARAQAPASARFVDTAIPPQGLLDYLARLFLARPGVFRLILFAVTSASVRADPDAQLTVEIAKKLHLDGEPGDLPIELGAQPLAGYECYALIYEFEKTRGVIRQVVPSALPAREHLSRAGITQQIAASFR